MTIALLIHSRIFSVFSSCVRDGCDLVRDRHDSIRHYLCFGVTYFLYDIWAMFVVFRVGEEEAQERDKARSTPKLTVSSPGQVRRFFDQRRLILLHHVAIPFIG